MQFLYLTGALACFQDDVGRAVDDEDAKGELIKIVKTKTTSVVERAAAQEVRQKEWMQELVLPKWGELKRYRHAVGISDSELDALDVAVNPKETLAGLTSEKPKLSHCAPGISVVHNAANSPESETSDSGVVTIRDAFVNLRKDNKVVLEIVKTSELMKVRDGKAEETVKGAVVGCSGSVSTVFLAIWGQASRKARDIFVRFENQVVCITGVGAPRMSLSVQMYDQLGCYPLQLYSQWQVMPWYSQETVSYTHLTLPTKA